MKKFISMLIVAVMMLSLCTVSVFAQDLYEGDFYINISGGNSIVTISWDEFYGAQMYRVSVNTDYEYYCVDELVKDTSYAWVPDANVTPDQVFDITVYAYDSNGVMIAHSNVVQATVVVYMCDWFGYYGDVDSDENITIIDATLTQKYLAKTYEFDIMKKQMADVDGDGIVTALDPTYVQQFIAAIFNDENRTFQHTMIGWVEYYVQYDKWWE